MTTLPFSHLTLEELYAEAEAAAKAEAPAPFRAKPAGKRQIAPSKECWREPPWVPARLGALDYLRVPSLSFGERKLPWQAR